jgi:glycogen synthase
VLTASIVVNTYNRARCLERLLPSLDHLSSVRFEVVVVNGPSTDDTETVLSRSASRIKVARCETPNLSRSRNIGIRAAAGDIVIFIDDDALPADAMWLERLLTVFEHDVECRLGAAGGASLHRDSDWPEFAGGWTSDYGEQRFTEQPADDEPSLEPTSDRWFRRTVGNNSAFRRSALVEIGGFDEHYPYYLDEADVCVRLARAGYRTAFIDAAAVRHYPASSPIGPPFIRNRRLIARSDTYYALKNGADPLPMRIVRTLALAPQKHFVRELPALVEEGRISGGDLWRLRAQVARGVAQGLILGLTTGRATPLTGEAPPALVPYQQGEPARRLSICLLSRRLPPDPHAGGVGRYTYDLARGLHERGHRVTIVTESDVALHREGLHFDIVGIRPAPLTPGLAQTPVLAQNLAYAESVLTYFQAQERAGRPFDVVHATNWGIDAVGLVQWGRLPLTLMLVTPLESVIAAEGWSVNQDLSANIELDQWMVERADRVVAPSLGVLDSYSTRDNWRSRAVHRVSLGTVPASPRPKVDDTSKRLLFVGRHERRKGIHVLLEALPGLLERHGDWRCDLVGNKTVAAGPGTTFESIFRERHAGAPWLERVTFHGAVSDAELPAFYAQADVFVAPSLFESFGLIYLEAMQHGVPVVGTSVGGVPDVVSHDVDGLLVPPSDAVALGAALERLMSNESLRRRLGAAASEAVRTTRSHLAMADRLVVEYEAAIAAHAERMSAAAIPDAGQRSVAERAIEALDAMPSTRGLSLAYRAAEAFDGGDRSEATQLIAEALTLTNHPDYYAMAVEWALADDNLERAATFAHRGFDVTCDDSESCLVFVACLLTASSNAGGRVDEWIRARAPILAARLLASAVTAIRSRRDGTAIVLLEACLARGSEDRRLEAQARYHLGSTLKRRGRVMEARTQLVAADTDGTTLPPALRSAVHFHLGELDLEAGRMVGGVEHLELCLELNPSHARARERLAEARSATPAA